MGTFTDTRKKPKKFGKPTKVWGGQGKGTTEGQRKSEVSKARFFRQGKGGDEHLPNQTAGFGGAQTRIRGTGAPDKNPTHQQRTVYLGGCNGGKGVTFPEEGRKPLDKTRAGEVQVPYNRTESQKKGKGKP